MYLDRSRPSLSHFRIHSVCLLALFAAQFVRADELPNPDGKPADMSQPVQVYILLGQSNMLGFGKITGDDGSLSHAVQEKGLYGYLVDDEGNWTERKDVRNVFVMGSGLKGFSQQNNEVRRCPAPFPDPQPDFCGCGLPGTCHENQRLR